MRRHSGKISCGAVGAIALMRAEKPARDVRYIWRLADGIEIHRILCFVEKVIGTHASNRLRRQICRTRGSRRN